MVVWYGVYYLDYTKKLYRHTDKQKLMYLHISLFYQKERVVRMSENSKRGPAHTPESLDYYE